MASRARSKRRLRSSWARVTAGESTPRMKRSGVHGRLADFPIREPCGHARACSIMPRMKKLALVLFFAACGGKTAATSSSTTPAGGGETATAALPDVAFDKLDHDQQIEFMKQKVVPAMKPIFQHHDAKKYAEFGCATCHGDQAKEGHFDMPNANLPKISYAKE